MLGNGLIPVNSTVIVYDGVFANSRTREPATPRTREPRHRDLFARTVTLKMSQKEGHAAPPRRPLPEHLITGVRDVGDERLIGGDTGLAAVMARAEMVARSAAPRRL